MITLFGMMQRLADVEPFDDDTLEVVKDIDCYPRQPAVYEFEAEDLSMCLKLLKVHGLLKERCAIMLVLFPGVVSKNTVAEARCETIAFAAEANIQLDGLAFGHNTDEAQGVRIIYTEYHYQMPLSFKRNSSTT